MEDNTASGQGMPLGFDYGGGGKPEIVGPATGLMLIEGNHIYHRLQAQAIMLGFSGNTESF